MSENWDVYFANVNEKLASLFVDLGLAEIAPDESKPTLLWLWAHVLSPDEDGFPQTSEAQQLFDLEDMLLMQMEKHAEFHFAGRITTDGRREFYMYAESAVNFPTILAALTDLFPQYTLEHGVEADPDWRHYFDVLYPTPTDLQLIQNRRVIQSLMEQNDALETPRPVTHWAYFSTIKQRQAFIDDARQLQFAVDALDTNDEHDDGMPYVVILTRLDSVDFASINEATIALFNLAQTHEGEYDGWETEIVSSDQ